MRMEAGMSDSDREQPAWRAALEEVWQMRLSVRCDLGHERTEANTQVRRARGNGVAVICRDCRGWRGAPGASAKAWHIRVRQADRDAEEALRELRLWVLEQRLADAESA